MKRATMKGHNLAWLGAGSRSRRRTLLDRALLACCALALAVSAAALAAGELDSSFGDGGIVRTPELEVAQGDPIAFDGEKTVIVGSVETTGTGGATAFNPLFAALRLNADGTPDSSFAGDGLAVLPPFRPQTEFGESSSDEPDSVAIDASGRVVIAGGSDELLAVARLNPDGSLDSSFSEDGMATFDFNTAELGYQPADRETIALDGSKLVIGSYASVQHPAGTNQDIAVTRLNDDGSPDTGFNGTGSRIIDFNGNVEILSDLALDGSKPVLLAESSAPDGGNFTHKLMRLNSDGSFDGSFGGDGVVDGDATLTSAVALQGSKPVVVGRTTEGFGDIALRRYTAEGALDASFGENGKVTTKVGQRGPDQPCLGTSGESEENSSFAEDVVIDGAGRILLAGSAQVNNFLLARYEADGAIEGLVAREVGVQAGQGQSFPAPRGMANGAPGIALAGGGGGGLQAVIARYRSDGPFVAAPNCDQDGVGAPASDPQTKIKKGPDKRTTKRRATFRFRANEKSTFECKLDRKKWRACKSPKTVKVNPGRHKFKCRATDEDGNTDRTPAVFRWKVLEK
jgi:uncharacterized delta-60 repeat protein